MSEFEKVTVEALALPAQNRVELAEMLIQSLDEEEDAEIKSAWLAEIRRRDQEIKEGKSVTRPAVEVLKEAREMVRCVK